jgi:hypothetical protein
LPSGRPSWLRSAPDRVPQPPGPEQRPGTGQTRERWDGEALLHWLGEEGGGRSLAPILALLAGLALLDAAFFLLNVFAGLPPLDPDLRLYVMIYHYSRTLRTWKRLSTTPSGWGLKLDV